MKESVRRRLVTFLKPFARRSIRRICAVLLLAVLGAFAMIGIDQLPRQWRLPASILFVAVLVLGLSWGSLVRGRGAVVRRRARRRSLVVGVAVLGSGMLTGFFSSPTQDFIALVPMAALATGIVWIGLARRG